MTSSSAASSSSKPASGAKSADSKSKRPVVVESSSEEEDDDDDEDESEDEDESDEEEQASSSKPASTPGVAAALRLASHSSKGPRAVAPAAAAGLFSSAFVAEMRAKLGVFWHGEGQRGARVYRAVDHLYILRDRVDLQQSSASRVRRALL